MTYLFFDLECANTAGGFGKICSFGYVLCSRDFSEIKSEDVLINPDCTFDPYLFRRNSRCRLSHRPEEYRRQAKFPQFYSKINALLSAPDRMPIAFGCQGDVAALVAECVRYGLPPIDFNCYDAHNALAAFYEGTGRLEDFVQKLGVSKTGLEFHDSLSDAIFTMKVCERLAADAQKSLEEIFAAFPPMSALHAREERVKKLFRNWLLRSEARKKARGQPLRTPKKVSVPDWFDYRRELLFELEQQEIDYSKKQYS